MLLRRVAERLRHQEWTAVAIDLAIVVLGVFIGIQVSNWNEARADRAAYEAAVGRLLAEINTNLASLDAFDTGMASGLIELMPSAREGHIGLSRDPITLKPFEYLVRLPEADGRLFILVDPMLATGNSLAHAVSVLNRHGVPDRMIRVMALVVAPEGMRRFQADFPDVPVYAAALDASLDANAYIVPGLGDAGDRIFGTKDPH